MREIVLDTETTGLDPDAGHRIIEIGCVELDNHVPTNNNLQLYINPQRDIPEESFKVHGLSLDFLNDKPLFGEVVKQFLEFIADAKLVIHNAEFDLKFLNAELARSGHAPIPTDRAIDTVQIARRRFPGAQASLDALCRRFEIDLSERSLHGALLDCQLLAAVYLELMGGRQPGLVLADDKASAAASEALRAARPHRAPRPHTASSAEEEAHARMLEKLKDPIWTR
ncbi:DNA polymerase III subunit epsilon [Fodinicurvata fenggangensis]|uniref:DNA polymerase III subunit epsilon n=1 Tax=Fodinicurvata fenggangensis TaxID=1121830 RepID=UPI00047D6656|nr:DNA polymerase III subunit epsilon [Fodinicurvata fenggangensis]